MMSHVQNRYDFVFLFDVTDGNPNGDPDAGNMPRIDAETGQGLVTDVCLKRKVRNYVGLTKGEQPPYEIYVKEKAVLNLQHQRAFVGIGEDQDKVRDMGKDDKKKLASNRGAEAKAWMCRNFFDVRTFGAVMSTGDLPCGQIRGPVQVTFARSVDPIVATEHSITRMAVTSEKESEKQDGDNRTMGRKSTVPYGLYRAHGFISASLAAQSGFSDDDLSLFWEALKGMFEHDRSAARGMMSARKVVVFKHSSHLGDAPAHLLLERVKVERRNRESSLVRSFSDYMVTVDKGNLPKGIEVMEVL